jgi:DNA-binding NarL/FixJ family response regulator
MGIAKRTVDKHRQNLMAKLGVCNAVELVQAAVGMGLV